MQFRVGFGGLAKFKATYISLKLLDVDLQLVCLGVKIKNYLAFDEGSNIH